VAEPRGTNVIYDRSDAAIRTATPNELTGDIDFDATDAVYTSGITPALSAQLQETTATILDQAQTAGSTTVFDLNYRSKLWSPSEAKSCCTSLLEAVDIAVIAARDARTVLDRTGSSEEILRELSAEFDPEVAVLTQGEDGAIALDADGRIHDQPAFPAETVDPIGTGDAFVGDSLASYLEEGHVSNALAYGSATAALKRTIAGDLAVVTPEEVQAVIENPKTKITR